jgi:hypothetical protein
MRNVLYILWFLPPVALLLIALWAKLEQFSRKEAREHSMDYVKNALFLVVCALVAIAIDTNILEDLVNIFSPDFIPLGFYQIMLLPAVLVIGAKIYGGSKGIRIDKAPRPSNVHKSRKR